MSSSSASAYCVMRRNHCSISLASTGVSSCCQQQPSTTCSLASTVWHLRAPVHEAALAIGQAALEHAQKKPLVPAIVFRLAGGNFAPPVVAEAEARQTAFICAMLALVHSRGANAALDGGIFGGQSEGIPADRMQHVESAHAPVARHRVADRVVAHVAHVQRARGIRQHFEQVIFRALRVAVRMERALLFPNFLPLRFNRLWIVLAQWLIHLLRRFDFARRALTPLLRFFASLRFERRTGKPSATLPARFGVMPTKRQSIRTFRRSSPWRSIGVSRMNARPARSG